MKAIIKKAYSAPQTETLSLGFTRVLMTSPDSEFGKKDGEPGSFSAPKPKVF